MSTTKVRPTVKVGQIYEAPSGNRYKIVEVVGELCKVKVDKIVNISYWIASDSFGITSVSTFWKLLPNIRQLPDHLKGKL